MDRVNIYNIIQQKDRQRQYEEEDIILAIDEVERTIINYCQIEEVPDALRFTVVNMSLDLLEYQFERNKLPDEVGVADIDIADVTAVKIGDTSITLGSGASSSRKKILSGHSAGLDRLTLNYREQLNRFRRLW